MRLWRRRYRSAGVTVSADTYAKIAAADRARAGRRWADAAALYAEALSTQPDLFHIRIQLGHALKEMGSLPEAETAYRAAHLARPGEREGRLHLAHALKLRGAICEAAEHYTSLAIANPNDDEAMREARDTVAYLSMERREMLAIAMGATATGLTDRLQDGFPPVDTCRIVYDATGLLTYFSDARWPTGIQRVQIETLIQALEQSRTGGERAGVCTFIEGRDEWVGIPAAAFLRLARLCGEDEGADAGTWREVRNKLYLYLLLAPTLDFTPGAVLVNLGTSWQLRNYFMHVRDAQVRRGIIFIPMIYDMIPAMFPDFCIDALVQDFINWTTEVFDHTSSFLAISEASKRDLIATAARIGHDVNPDDVEVVPLNADFGAASRSTPCAVPALPDDTGPFVLFVSTIEPRKGHLVAFDAWSSLIRQLGSKAVPRLICVGRNGWRNAAIFERLNADPMLQMHVTVLSDLSDRALAGLYQASLFTIYPSLYEGWGLPVTEALCRGKAVITTTSSSLPEAGGKFAIFVPPNDAAALASEVRDLIEHPATLRAREALIAEQFAPTSWGAIAQRIADAVASLSERASRNPQTRERRLPPVARLGASYWMGRSNAMTPRPSSGSGEPFRTGLGWRAPASLGCQVGPHGGRLAMRVEESAAGEVLSLMLRLTGNGEASCPFRITSDVAVIEDHLERDERLTVFIAVVVSGSGCVEILVENGVDPSLTDAGPDRCESAGIYLECFSVQRPAAADLGDPGRGRVSATPAPT